MNESPDTAEAIDVEFEPADTGKSPKSLWRLMKILVIGGLLCAAIMAAIIWSIWYFGVGDLIGGSSDTPSGPSVQMRLDRIEKDVSAIRKTVATNRNAARPQTDPATRKRLGQLEQKQIRLQNALDLRAQALASMQQNLRQMRRQLDDMETLLASGSGRPSPESDQMDDLPLPSLVLPVPPEPVAPYIPDIPVPRDDNQGDALRLAMTTLDLALRSDAPFVELHALLVRTLPENAQIAALAPIAPLGAPTWPTLARRFARLRSQMATEEEKNRQDRSLTQRIMARLLTVRPTDRRTDNEAALTTAENALRNKDFETLAEALDGFGDQATQAIWADFLMAARRRHEAEGALALLRIDAARSSSGPE